MLSTASMSWVITTEVAEIEHVVDETDHGAGSQPFYR